MKKNLLILVLQLTIHSFGFALTNTPGSSPTPDQFPYFPKFIFTDMAYGKDALALLGDNDVYAVRSLTDRPTVVGLPQNCKNIEYGNGVFVIAGYSGFLASSRDLQSWNFFEFRDNSITEIEDYSAFPIDNSRPYFTKLLFLEGKFHALTDNLDYVISSDGIGWDIVGKIAESNFPTDPNIERSAQSTTFTSNGKSIRFDSEGEGNRRISELQDSGHWLPTGVFNDSAFTNSMGVSNEVMIHTGADWIGIRNGVLFEKRQGVWQIYNDVGNGSATGFMSVDFASERVDNSIYLGSKPDGLYRSRDGLTWEKLDGDQSFDLVRYINQTGFVLAHNTYDYATSTTSSKIYLTLSGDSPKLIFERENYEVTDVVKMGLMLVILGKGEGDAMVLKKRLPLEYDYLPPVSEIIFDSYLDGIDMDSTLSSGETPSTPRVVGGLDYSNNNPETGILTTRTKVYHRENTNWVEVMQVPEHSWVTCAYFYRNQYFVGATNYQIGNRIYIPPPEGTEPSSQLFYSSDGISWERRELDFQPLLDRPSTDGPMLVESVYTALNTTRRFEAVEGPDLTSTIDDLPESLNYLWAKGRYLAYRYYSTEISPFMGFEDAWYYRMLHEDSVGNTYGETRGWFGTLDPTHYPVLNHQTFGEVEFEIDTNDNIYLTSDQYGVLRSSRAEVPYFTSLADGNIYYANFSNGNPLYRFYNHNSNQWVESMDCESFDYERWYQVCIDQTVKVQNIATETVVAVQNNDVLSAYDLLQQTIREYKTLSQFIKMGKELETSAQGTNPAYNGWPITNESFDTLQSTALEALNWASGYYSENI